MKPTRYLVAAALLFGAAPTAHADDIRVYRGDGYTTRVQCNRYYGCTTTTTVPQSNSAKVIRVPDDSAPNINDHWGGGEPVASLPRATFEAGR